MKAKAIHTGINGVLALTSLALLLFIAWRLLTTETTEISPGMQLIQPVPRISLMMSWRWFDNSSGPAGQAQAALEEQEEQLTEASINAELLGVMRTAEYATATISINGQAEKVFSIGDELQSGVELVSVSTSRVILNERGRRVQITMRRPDGNRVQLSQAPQNSVNTTQIQNGFSLANMFDAIPVQLENNTTGFKLDGLSEEMQSLSEIQEGDVITLVGNTTIDELMSNPGQWMNYSTETSLPVTVLRDGQETTLYVNAFSLSARILPNITNGSTQ